MNAIICVTSKTLVSFPYWGMVITIAGEFNVLTLEHIHVVTCKWCGSFACQDSWPTPRMKFLVDRFQMKLRFPPGLQKIVTCVVCMRFSCLTPLHPYIPTCSTFWPMKPGCWPSKSYLEMTWVPAESHLPCTTSGFRAAKLVQRWKSVFRSVSWRPPEHLPLPHGWRLFLITNLGMKWLKINHGKPHLIPLNHIESWPFNRMKPH